MIMTEVGHKMNRAPQAPSSLVPFLKTSMIGCKYDGQVFIFQSGALFRFKKNAARCQENRPKTKTVQTDNGCCGSREGKG